MYIVADIGGTKTRIAGSTDLDSFSEPVILDTPQAYSDGLGIIVTEAQKIAGNEKIDALSLGISGVIIRENHTMIHSNTPDWDEKPVVKDLQSALSTSVYIENDTAQVGLGEAVYGAGKGAKRMMYMTVSTGVNAALIENGAVVSGVYGSETGEQFLFVDGDPKRLGELISGNAIFQRYGKHPRDLGKDSPVWDELAHITACGVYNSIVHWSPERIVLGGSMFNDIGISVEQVKKHIEHMNTKYPTLPSIVHSSLGDLGGLWGGMARLRELHH